MPCELPFDAALFDLDGTLVATDRFWVQAARTGTRRAFEELGIEAEPPRAEAWMGIVGLPPEPGFASLFPDRTPEEVQHLRRACEEEERRLILSGGAALMPGALEVLRQLRDAGLRLGIASNCSASYLESMLARLGLDALVHEAYCIESKGVRSKADMLARLLERFDTRSAIMVGDRVGDRDAAWENGLPHVHCRFGFAPPEERVEAEASIEDLGELPALLRRRATWIEGALERCGALESGAMLLLGITGESGAGRTLFARDAVRSLARAGVAALALDAGRFRRPAAATAAALEEWYDLEALERHVAELRAGGAAGSGAPEVLVIEGPFLLDPRLQSRIDRVVHLEVSEAVRWRRLAGRDRSRGTDDLVRFRTEVLRLEREHRARYDPRRLADLVLPAETPFGPADTAVVPVP